MDFYDVVAQVIQLLQQQGRVTYRGIKLQFKLDDEILEALKEELLYSQEQISDDSQGLTWNGEPLATLPNPQPETDWEILIQNNVSLSWGVGNIDSQRPIRYSP